MALTLDNLPPGAVPAQATSGNVANAIATATIAAVALKTNWLQGILLSVGGATLASAQLVTITGLLGGTLTIPVFVPAGVLLGTVLPIVFPRPLRAAAVNTAIVVSLPACGAGNTNAAASAFGYTA